MPRYDYECTSCHHSFELKQSFTSEPVATCPKCENTARRKIHSVPVVFKGSGWYVNDYGKRGSAGRSSSESSDGSESSSKSESKDSSESTSKSKGKSESSTKTKSESGSSTSKSD